MNVLEKHVLQIIGENTNSPDVFLDTDDGLEPIRESLNDAIQEISAITGSNIRTYHVPLVSGQSFYRIRLAEGSFGWVTDAFLVNQGTRLEQTDLIRLNHFDPRWLESRGTPESYFQIGARVIGFYRQPTDNDIVELNCVVVPKRYATSADRIQLRDTFKWAAVHYAVSEFWASRGDAMEARREFDRYLTQMGLQDIYPKANDRGYQFRTNKEPYEVR